MKAKQLRELSDRDLQNRLDELKAELFNLRFQSTVGQLGNPMRIRQVRRDIARVFTVVRERELGIERARAAVGSGAAAGDKQPASPAQEEATASS